jgi:uncharacterized glyoxalase superfamily protein PhnB
MPATPTSFQLRSLTPVLIVDSVEPCLDFWVDSLAFTKENEVPGPDGKIVFASVKKDGIEIMYQSRASVAADTPAQAEELSGHSTALFITVPSIADLDAIEARIKNAPSVKPRHETFYGSMEFYVREPGGNVVGFAAFK